MAGNLKLGEILIASNLITRDELDAALKEQKEKGGFLGQILINRGLVSSADIERALEQASAKVKEKTELGQMLIADKKITPEQLKIAQEKQGVTKKGLDDLLVESGFLSHEQIAQVLSCNLGIPFVKLSDQDIKLEVLQLLPENIIRNYQVIPIKLEEDTLTVAMADPLNILAVEEIKLISKYKISPVVAIKKEIRGLIERYFSLQQMSKQIFSDMRVENMSDDSSVSRLVDNIIRAGINSRASDIHLEPQFPEMRVRFRIDGILHDIITVSKPVESALISRIKVLSDMDIAEHRRPQDGHMSIKANDNEYDLRIASTSTISGEKIVIRILDKTGMLISLNDLGLPDRELDIFRSLIARPYGIILVTGPTGSGKTTTLYAVLGQIDTMTKNIMTIEDPVEYKLKGINQVQVNPQANITFAAGLRSMLRQDPDVIMVGEIRDLETATVAIQAALTGHLVFATLHTNDAPSAVTRLIDMGVEPFLISSALMGVIAQRLIRVICPECKESYSPDSEELKGLDLSGHKEKLLFYKGKGCPYCMQTGYRGRAGVYELMNVSDKIRELILEKQPATKIKEVAVKEGMSALKDAALKKVIQGVSTPEEIKRVIFASGG